MDRNRHSSRLIKLLCVWVSLSLSLSANLTVAQPMPIKQSLHENQLESAPVSAHSTIAAVLENKTQTFDLASNHYNSSGIPGKEGGREKGGGNNKKWIVPAIIVGAIAVAAIHNAMSKEPEGDKIDDPEAENQQLEKQLKSNGPQFSARYNMSAFMLKGMVKGGWPLVIEFEHQQPGYIELMVRTRSSDTFRFRLDGGEVGRRHIVLPLPAHFGDEPKPALIAVTARTSKQSKQTLAGFRLIGLGAGPRALGSVAVDKVTVDTDRIQSSLGQTAAYKFYAHSDFENAKVDFMKVAEDFDGERNEWVNTQELVGGVAANQWVGEQERLDWDGRNAQQQISEGAHKLQVRVWHKKGDWVSAWSDSAFVVSY